MDIVVGLYSTVSASILLGFGGEFVGSFMDPTASSGRPRSIETVSLASKVLLLFKDFYIYITIKYDKFQTHSF